MSTLILKRGDTLELECQLKQAGKPIDIAGWDIRAAVVAPGGAIVHQFSAVITAPADGAYRLPAASAVTWKWPPGGLNMDIRYTDPSGYVMTTETVAITVLDAQTPPRL